jgi:hypothetical protein
MEIEGMPVQGDKERGSTAMDEAMPLRASTRRVAMPGSRRIFDA